MWLPPDHPNAPGYWMYETSGRLKPCVEAYLKGETLSRSQIQLMKAYLLQWVSAPVWAPSTELEMLRLRVNAVQSQRELTECTHAAEDLGMDPL